MRWEQWQQLVSEAAFSPEPRDDGAGMVHVKLQL
jgi:hypothetical protein